MTLRTNTHTIDVVIPVYNGADFILDAIGSAASQTLLPDRIIVVDDGSTDRTNELVSLYAKTSSVSITVVRKENGGLSSARNAGIKESTAEFIAFLDADDTWTEDKLEAQMKVYAHTRFLNLALVYCNYDVIDRSGTIQYVNYKAPLDARRMRGVVFRKLLERNQIAGSGSGVLIKRAVFDTVGLFDEKLKFGEDWDMWLRIAEKHEVDFSEKTLVHIRKHGNNMTADPRKVFDHELDFYKKWIMHTEGRFPIPAFWADKILFRILSRFPNKDFLLLLENKIPRQYIKKLFRNAFGSLWLYAPLSLVRHVLAILFDKNYRSILVGFLCNAGK